MTPARTTLPNTVSSQAKTPAVVVSMKKVKPLSQAQRQRLESDVRDTKKVAQRAFARI